MIWLLVIFLLLLFALFDSSAASWIIFWFGAITCFIDVAWAREIRNLRRIKDQIDRS